MKRDNMELLEKGWGMVERNIDQISNIVLDMLIYSKDRQPEHDLVDPNELATDVLELMREKARLSGPTVSSRPSARNRVTALRNSLISWP